jgi:hypothetical protein
LTRGLSKHLDSGNDGFSFPISPLDRHLVANIQCACFDFSGYDRAALGDAEDIFNGHAKGWIGGHLDTPFLCYIKMDSVLCIG